MWPQRCSWFHDLCLCAAASAQSLQLHLTYLHSCLSQCPSQNPNLQPVPLDLNPTQALMSPSKKLLTLRGAWVSRYQAMNYVTKNLKPVTTVTWQTGCDVINGRLTSAFSERSREKQKQTRQKKSRSSRKMQSKGHRQIPEEFRCQQIWFPALKPRFTFFPRLKACWTLFTASPAAGSTSKCCIWHRDNSCPRMSQILLLKDRFWYRKPSRSNSAIHGLYWPEIETSLGGRTRLIDKGFLQDPE